MLNVKIVGVSLKCSFNTPVSVQELKQEIERETVSDRL